MKNSDRAIASVAPGSGKGGQRRDVGTLCADCPARSRKPRSYQQHKRYFAVIKAVLSAWPETHPEQFPNKTALRKWLQMKAKHYTTRTLDLYGIPASKARPLLQAYLDSSDPYSEARVLGNNLVIFSPASINYDTLGHADFCALNDEVDAVIREETGLDPVRVLLETERAA